MAYKLNVFTKKFDIDTTLSLVTLDSRYLNTTSNLFDLDNVATARNNLGLVAGGTGDIWVEKAGDTMNGDLTVPNINLTGAKIYDNTNLIWHRPGTQNSFLGYQSGNVSVSGYGNTGLGHYCLPSVTSGFANVFVGSLAGQALTEGYYNVMVGYGALQDAVSAHSNVGLGAFALNKLTTGYGNFGLGFYSLRNATTAVYNVAIGSEALVSLTADNSGRNIAIGAVTLYSTTSGVNNVAIGTAAGYSNSTGSANVFIGHNAGYNETGSNKLYIESSSSTTPLIYGEFDNDLVKINGSLYIPSDSKYIYLGAGNDATLIYDGTNLLLNPKALGSGYLNVQGQTLLDDKLMFTQTDGNEYIDSLADGYMDYRATTAHRFGDGTNQLVIDADGDLSLAGTAKYERHIQIDAKADGTVANQPAQVDFFTASGLQFASVGAKYDYAQWEVPDDWDGTDVYFEIDWFPDSGATSGTDAVRWTVEYRAIAEGELISNGTAVTVDNGVGGDTADYAQYTTKHTRFTLTYNNANQPLTKQDHVYFKISRDTSVSGDFAGTVTVSAYEIIYTSTGFPTSN